MYLCRTFVIQECSGTKIFFSSNIINNVTILQLGSEVGGWSGMNLPKILMSFYNFLSAFLQTGSQPDSMFLESKKMFIFVPQCLLT